MIRLLLLLCAVPLAAAPITQQQALAYLGPWESFRLESYKDGRVNMSVGLGHSLTAHGEPVMARYTEDECLRFFARDFANAQRICRIGVRNFDGLPLAAQEVCIGLAWCCGPTGFLRFVNLRRALAARAFENAAVELYLSRWFWQVGPARANAAVKALRNCS